MVNEANTQGNESLVRRLRQIRADGPLVNPDGDEAALTILQQDREIQRLRLFIELCRDTFADFQMANRIIGRTLQADAARAGYDACVKCLAGEKVTTEEIEVRP